MTGSACPECGRRRAGAAGAEHRVPCRCGGGPGPAPLTGDEQRAARTAEMAAAEDFDPLRIRPYVNLADGSGKPGAGDVPGAAATTMPLFLGDVGPVAPPGPAADTPGGAHPGPDESRRRTPGPAPDFGADPVQPRRRRPFGALAVAAAVAAVVATAAFAGGLFDDDHRDDEALPETSSSVPDIEDGPAASVAPSPSSSSAAPSRTPSAPAAPSAPPSASASPSESGEPGPTTTASASPSRDSAPAPDAEEPPEATATAAPPLEPAAVALRPGDRGPEVADLQNRLRRVGEWLYSGPSDAHYSDRVERSVTLYQSYKAIQGDPPGVYGPNTRQALETETGHRGHRR